MYKLKFVLRRSREVISDSILNTLERMGKPLV